MNGDPVGILRGSANENGDPVFRADSALGFSEGSIATTFPFYKIKKEQKWDMGAMGKRRGEDRGVGRVLEFYA